MSSDRSRRHDDGTSATAGGSVTAIDDAHEALRTLVRVLAREAAREVFAKSCAAAETASPEPQT